MQNGENDKKKKSNKNRGKKSELTRVNATNLPHTTWYQDKKKPTIPKLNKIKYYKQNYKLTQRT